MKRALPLLVALVFLLTTSATLAQDFSNVNVYDDELSEARDRGIVFDESTLENPITRQQLVEFVVPFAFTQAEIDSCTPSPENWAFNDADPTSAFATDALCIANREGVIQTNDQFFPDRIANLPEIAKIMATAFDFPVGSGNYDVWYDGYLITMMTAGIVLPSEVYSEIEVTQVTNKLALAYIVRMQNYLDNPDKVTSVQHVDRNIESQKQTCAANQLLHQSDLAIQSYEQVEGNYYRDNEALYYMETKSVSAEDDYAFSDCFEPFQLLDSTPNSFEILYGDATHLYGTYVNSGNNIYIDGLEIEGVNVSSFQPLDYRLSKDSNHVYDKTQIQANADANTFAHVVYHYYKDKDNVYINYGGLSLFEGADAATFVPFEDSYFAIDANNVYNLSPTYGFVLAGADAGTFELWGRWHGKDNDDIFYRRGTVSSIDYDTAEFLGSYYIKDANNVYCGATIIDGADAATFEYLGDNVAKDATTTYDNCQPVRESDELEELLSRYFDLESDTSLTSYVGIDLSPRCEATQTFPPMPALEANSNRSTYAVHADLDYASRTLDASERMRYMNHTGQYLTDILLNIENNREEDIFCLGDLTWSDGSIVDPSLYTYNGPYLRLTLPQPLPPNGTVELGMRFAWNIPDSHWSFGTVSTQQLRFVDWFPYVPPYDLERGWITSEPGVDDNNAYNFDDFDVTIDLSGEVAPVIAASSAPKINGNRHEYKFSGRTFVFVASPDYQVIEHSLGNDVKLVNYVFPQHVAEAESVIPYLTEAYELFTELYGPLTEGTTGIVEIGFVDAMEYPGMHVLGSAFYSGFDGGRLNFLTSIHVHELAHQWWYSNVGNDQYAEPYLDEMFAQYSEYLYYESLGPDALAWWEDFRKDRRNSNVTAIGPVNSHAAEFDTFGQYVTAIYDRGVNFMKELREVLGDDLFFQFLKALATENAQGRLTSEIFFETLEEYYNMRPNSGAVSDIDHLSLWQNELHEIEAAYEGHSHHHVAGGGHSHHHATMDGDLDHDQL